MFQMKILKIGLSTLAFAVLSSGAGHTQSLDRGTPQIMAPEPGTRLPARVRRSRIGRLAARITAPPRAWGPGRSAPIREAASTRDRSTQAGVDLVERRGAGTQLLLAQRVEGRRGGVEVGVQILGVVLDV